ncbi:non-ribosomal peptide synthase/polyketide synthase [Okeanomitos corallinicola TIOX110]|uniref:Non-ribosomal peptide synthase/polyketide synthase n=1 Tax=Okeanomitos corallinicola TIOX110 TaxID=3133117 RepID=A0ABZ2USY7_9CYAN
MKLELNKTNRQNIEDIYPLSPMQEGMLFESLYAPEEGVYFEQITFTFNGDINVKAFEKAWQQVVNRHAIFRTAFMWESVNQPVQIVYKQVDINIDFQDWRELSQPEQKEQLEEFLVAESKKDFQLAQAPLIRLYLLQLAENKYQFIWCHHHILLDGWSLPIVFKDLFAFYQAIIDGVTLKLKPAVKYRNYIAWLKQQKKDLAQEFWQQQLQGFSAPTPLVVDKLFSSSKQDNGYLEKVVFLTDEKTIALTEFVKKHKLTMNNLLQGIWSLLLSRYSQEHDIVFGSTVSGRPPSLPDVESMVGLFINTLPVRVKINENSDVLSLLKNLQQQQVESEQYSYCSLVEIQGWSDVPRGNGLFDSLVVFENYPLDAAGEDDGNLKVENFRGIAHTNFPLVIAAGPGDRLWLRVSYDSSRFEDDTINRMLGHLQTLLVAIVKNPHIIIKELPLLTTAETQQLLIDCNQKNIDFSVNECIHQLFESQVNKTPDAITVVYENQQLTYFELNQKANQLANYLISLGVKPDTLVGICVERSLEMMIGILGILKAGAAYVPLDPEYPQERLHFILQDAQVYTLVTQEYLVNKLPENTAKAVYLDTNWNLISQCSCENPVTEVNNANLAYVIYTSGSTGTPKGVLVKHCNVTRLFAATQSWYNFNSEDVWTLFHSYAFDFSVWEIWGALLYGGKLVVVPYLVTRSPESFYQLLSDEKVTVLNQTPSAFSQLIAVEESRNHAQALNLRLVIFGGESLDINSLQPWFERHGDKSPQLVNMYGITETTVHVTYRPLSQDDLGRSGSVIGRPIPDLQVYVLDQYLRIVPVGVPGEMYVGGAGVTRGYLNRSELTEERFIPHPWLSDSGNVLYKTGDLAKYLPDGDLEYLGRIDNQVKIRGFRIELGEIEAMLSQSEDVQACCVMVREDTPGDKRLVAYIVGQNPQSLSVNTLRQFLKDRLPDYMLPGAFVVLDALPLTANGKIDRRALPSPSINTEGENKYVAPRTATEEILVMIWSQVLKVERVGIYDNFFALGGHSLLATQLISRIRSSFQIELPLRNLFTTATLAELGELIQQQQQQKADITYTPILPRAAEEELQLSYAQQRLWFLDQLEPNSSSYNIPIGLRLQGKLEIAALEKSFTEIINRHQALRTNFIAGNGTAAQIIHTAKSWKISLIDLLNLSPQAQEKKVQELVTDQGINPFNLANESLIRATLIVLSETEYILSICIHHIVADGWSMGVFIDELMALYNAYIQGQESPLEALQIQYADFAIWQRNWLQGEVLDRQLNYWEKQLKTAPTFLELPTDRPRPAVQTFAGAYQEFTLSAELTDKLTKLSQQYGVTLFMTLLAGFKTLLFRYTGQTDILVGSPIANRHHREVEGLIGFFVNTLVLRTDISGNPKFNELLTRIRSTALSAYTHQDLPFEMLVEILQPERDLSHSPLFQVMFILQNAPMSEIELTGLTVNSLAIETATAKFDLTLSMKNTATELVGVWEYNTDLFDSSTITRMTSHFVNLLEAIVVNPQEQINQLPFLNPEEKQQLLVAWNDTEKAYPHEQCLHQLFEEQVKTTPDFIAVEFGEQQLTYQQLNSRANQLANYLISLGVKADVVVGICVQRSLEMIVGILAILKAGGAYLPLDPEYPIERLQFMVEDANIPVLITQTSLKSQFNQYQGHTICVDTDLSVISQYSEENTNPQVKSENLGYVIYTSGSTGKPKGVAMSQLALANLIFWHVDELKVTSEKRTLQFSPLSFDASFHEMFTAWHSGGTLVLITEEMRLDAVALLGFIEENRIHRLFIPFVGLQQIAEVAVSREFFTSHLQEIITAGEQLQITPSIAQWLSKLTNNCTLHNHYGPSETHVVTTYTLTGTVETWPLLPPIGRPIANTQVYILDKQLQPVPVGVPGELYIGGVALANGYLNRPELTAERFTINPFDENSRLYKTGDLVKYLPDGNIEFLGRIDNQVKIRGFRIELGEIEAVLSQYEDVEGCCAIAREDIPGDKRLVAYVVGANTLTSSNLRQFLQGKLPEYMLPTAFVILAEMPQTPSGKVDRRALPAPDVQSEITETYVAPRTATEEILTLIWAEVLKIERVGITDNFFELGGHSLLATQIVSRISSSFQIEIPLKNIFTAPTIEQQAQIIEQTQKKQTKTQKTPIKPRIEKTEIPLSYGQQRLWFIDKLEPNSASYNLPAALKLQGELSIEALEKSFQTIINKHESLRTNIKEIAGKPQQIIHQKTNWKISTIDIKALSIEQQQKETKAIINQQTNQLFNLEKDSLIRATLIKLTETENIFTLCMHHIISDGWSMGVFIEELVTIYNSYIQGKETELKPLPIQYADFAIWQRNWLQGEVLEQQINYWSKQLENAPTFLPLPTDRPRPAVQTFAGAYQEFTISKELTNELQKVSKEQGVTLFMTLLAAYNTLLYRYTGQTDILVGTPIANRNRKEIESLIGFFVNTLVLRTELSGNSKFSEILNKTRSTALSAYAHQDLPFEMLVEALEIERDLSHSPLFQAVFALQNAPISEIELTGLKTNLLPIETATAKFDLTLSIEQTETGLIGGWEYNTDLFDSSTINRMTGHFINLLSAIVENPQTEINQLPILTATEKQQLLIDWNKTETENKIEKTITQLFTEQVEKTPNAVAVVFENQQLTYSELNNKANQLAHYLISLGVKADILVGICVERSLEMIIGQLGILKAGASYLPIDPEYPTERIKFILEDTKINILLTQQNLKQKIQNNQTQTTCLDTEWEKINQQNQKNPHKEITSNHLAYVIYTSGSTGTPKGVEITHQGLTNLINWHQKQFKITTADKATQLAGTGFDAAVWETWPYLTAGATLHLVRKEILVSPEQLQKWLTENQITISFVPTPITQELLKLDWKKEKTKLRYLLTGGDKLTQNPTNKIPFQVINNYGPTENTVVTTSCILETQKQTSPSIGKPIDNTKVYILDSNLQPVPVGVAGELHIAGTGLARGYLNRPELTAEKFIPNPFDNGKTKLYKTGDLVRYLTDGNIEYLGRSDNQVKIRGFRIEIGEIETALNQNENVQTSVVVVREDKPGYKKLVAYIVSETKLKTKELRKYLKSKLPEYMIPSNFVYLENLPLTPNGKIDRRALPEPKTNTEIEKKYIAPKTEIETKLAEIWQQVLGIEKIGINDNFFELGGDSILSIQIIAKAKQQGIEITLKQLFANQTIGELAAVAGTIKTLEIEQVTVSGNFLLTPIQKWFLEQNRPETHHFNQAFLLTVPAEIDRNKIEKTWQEIINHHDALRLRFTETENQWKATHSEPIETFEIEYFDISEVTETEKTEIIETTADTLQASLDLESNLVKVGLFKLGENQPGRLLIIIHHLVVDGISWRILLEDLETGYQQLNQNQKIQLPAKTTSFKTWSEKLSEYAQTETLKSEIDYWVNKSNSAIKSIPVDKEGENTLSSTQNIAVSLNQKETTALLQEVPKAYKTQINDILLTALVLVLSKWTNSKSVLFNLEGHGREDILDGVEISRTIGWFTTMFPVVINIEKTEFNNLENTIKSVKEQLREIPNKGIGYGVLRYLSEDKSIKKQITKTPKAEISFNYLGQFTQTLNTSSLLSSADESSGQDQSSVGQRSNLLDINAIIAEEHLQINWTYSNNIHEKTTVEKIAQEFITALQEIITHCLEPENVGYTPSDFPLIKLKQPELDGVLGKLGKLNWQNIEDIYPLSPMQEGMLFESLYAPEGGVYFEQITCTFNGELNIKAFEKAWQKLVNRHSIFRTAFIWESLSQAVQVVYKQVDLGVEIRDWRELSEQQTEIETFLEEERKQGFKLDKIPLMRLYLLQLSDESYQFVWCHHHILLDGWSLPLVFKDLFEFYQEIIDGVETVNKPSLNYRNYIEWLQQQKQDAAQEFWQEKLSGFDAPTPLVVEKSLSSQKTQSEYKEEVVYLSVEKTNKATEFVRKHQLTMSNLVQGVWGLLLSRYSQENDVVFGSTVSGRPPSLPGVESMVGLFINTLPVRVQVSDDNNVLSLLKELQQQQVESEQFSYCSLVEIQGWSDVTRGTSLFDSLVVFENYPVDADTLDDDGGLQVENFRGIEHTNYPLTVISGPGEQLWVKVSYDNSRFDEGTINRMLGHFLTLLSAIVENSQGEINQLPILTATEEKQLLIDWNQTETEYPKDKCIHQLFEEQVEKTPDAVAVVFENQQLTYSELNNKANQLAHYLISLGVKADVLVGICVERSVEMIVGILGILKAGGAYVPLDPEYPQERLNFILEDAQVSVLVTQESLVDKLPENTAEVVYLDTGWNKISQSNQENPTTEVNTSNLAYVIYTSGSTGTPKGVLVKHCNVTRLFAATQSWYNFNSEDVWTLFHSYAFDFSVWEIWGALLYGGKLVVVPYLVTRSPESFYQLLSDEKVTVLNQTPSAFSQLIAVEESRNHAQALNLRLVIFGGESLDINSLQPWFERHGDKSPQLVNMYGITETTVHVTYRPLSQDDLGRSGSVIGRPIPDLQVYVLDQYLRIVPVGVPGEMYVGGAGVTRGYLNRSELTEERFIPHPWLSDSGNVLYKTGDLAKYLPDGDLEYLGRIDNQVKIRGFRIELGEIEAMLSQSEDVQACCVMVREDTPGDKRLVAYIVGQNPQSLSVNQLRQFLRDRLPDYMLPGAFVVLDAFPLTANGKIDRRALKAPEQRNSDTFVSPRNGVELQLVQIWSKVLKVDNVGVKDNFFDLGGHSLLAFHLMGQIKEQFGKDIPLAALFQSPTIEDLAIAIQQYTSSEWSPLVAIQPYGSQPPLFCIPGSGGFPFYFYNLARFLGEDQPFYSFQAQGEDGELVPMNKIEDVATRYIQAMQAVQPHGPYYLGGHSFGGKVAFEMAQQLFRQGEEIALVAILDTTAPKKSENPTEVDDATWLIDIAKSMQVAFAKDLEMDGESLRSLPLTEQLQYVLNYLHRLDLLPPNADTKYVNNLLQAYKANSTVEYVPQDFHPLPITLFRASEFVSAEQQTALPPEFLEDVSLGWNPFSSEPVDVEFVPGNHVTMMTQPHVQVFAERLKSCLQQKLKS